MPTIRSVGSDSTSLLSLVDRAGTKRLLRTTVPSNITLTQAQAFVNTWIANNITGYQVVCKVLQLSPLKVAITVAGLGVTIPDRSQL